MLNVSLFLGLSQDAFYEKTFEEMDPLVKKLYISNHPESYLNQTIVNGVTYLGKFLGETAYVSDLELLEKNIYSILHKIIPGHSHENHALELIIISSPS